MVMNPEQLYAREHIRHQEALSEEEEIVNLDFAQPYRRSASAIDDFDGLYSDIERARDKQRQNQHKHSFQIETTERAIILEAILAENLEMAEWLGGNAYTFQTTEFDDQFNYTDLVVEFDLPPGPEYLAIDVTVSLNSKDLYKKSEGIRTKIDAGALTNIKYFESNIDGEQKALSGIPNIVISVPREELKKIAQKQYRALPRSEKGEIDSKGKSDKQALEELAKDDIQFNILNQIEEQLTDQAIYVLQHFKNPKDVPPKYREGLQKLIKIVGYLPAAKADAAGRNFSREESEELIDELIELIQDKEPIDAKPENKLSSYQMLKKISKIRKVIRDIIKEKKEQKKS